MCFSLSSRKINHENSFHTQLKGEQSDHMGLYSQGKNQHMNCPLGKSNKITALTKLT